MMTEEATQNRTEQRRHKSRADRVVSESDDCKQQQRAALELDSVTSRAEETSSREVKAEGRDAQMTRF